MKNRGITIQISAHHLLVLAGIIALGAGGIVGAQAFTSTQAANSLPLVIPYQGTLSKDGQPFNGTQNITFALYDDGLGGNVLWTSNPRNVDVVGGKFAVTLGDSNDTNEQLTPADFQQTALYVSVTIDGAELLPRQRIAPAPQAAHAGTAQLSNLAQNAAGNLRSELDILVPVGTIVPFAGELSKVPTGWLPCDGRCVRRVDYPDLHGAIEEAWGNCGTDSFNVPDTRGYFLRGNAKGTGRDPDATQRTALKAGGNDQEDVGSLQNHAMQKHHHNMAANVNNSGQGAGFHLAADTGYGNDDSYKFSATSTSPTLYRTSNAQSVPTSLFETRPANVSVNFIIKY